MKEYINAIKTYYKPVEEYESANTENWVNGKIRAIQKIEEYASLVEFNNCVGEFNSFLKVVFIDQRWFKMTFAGVNDLIKKNGIVGVLSTIKYGDHNDEKGKGMLLKPVLNNALWNT